jgi:hypothetical protein
LTVSQIAAVTQISNQGIRVRLPFANRPFRTQVCLRFRTTILVLGIGKLDGRFT